MAAKLTLLEEEWARQPSQYPSINWRNKITRDIAFAFEAVYPETDLVTKVSREALGSGVSADVGRAGRNYKFSGAQANRSCSFGVHLGLMGATEATWDIMIYFDAGNASAHFFGQWDHYQKWLLQNNAGTLVWVPAQDDSLGRRRFDSSAPVFGSAGWYRVILSWSGGSGAVMMINRSVVGAIEVSGYGVVIGPSNTADYLQIGMINGGSPLAGNVLFARAWRRGLSLSEMFSLNDNPWQIFEPEEIPLFKPVVTAQYARPVSDVSAGGWTASTGSDLYAMLDETSANDSDYITTTSASTCEVALGSLTDPTSSTGHIVRYRISATGGGIIVRLREGTTTIASWTHNPAPGSLTTYAQTLSGGEADSIINYAALKLQFEAIT